MQQVDAEEAKVRLLDLIDAVLGGETVVITKDNQAVVQLLPVAPARRRRQAGSARGLIQMSDDFDAPLDDFREYME